MKTEKINIHLDRAGLDRLNNDVNHVTDVLTEISQYLKDELSIVLTKELALDILNNSGKGCYKIYNADQSKKLDKAGLSGSVKAKMLESAQDDILCKLSNFQNNLSREGLNKYNAIDGLNYISFNAKGLPEVTEQDNEAMTERFTTYAETEAHLEMYEAHQAAVQSLNHLRDITRKHMPRAFFIAPVHFYNTFFDMNANNEVFSAKELNYKSF